MEVRRKNRGRDRFGSCHIKVDRFAGHIDYNVHCTTGQTYAGAVCQKRGSSIMFNY